MTTTAIRTAVADSGRYPSTEARRAALLELAEGVVTEQPFNSKPWTGVVPLVVPALASAQCPDLMVAFNDLVEAVSTRHAFVADPDEWLVAQGLPLGSATWEAWDESTEQQVQDAIDALMSTA